MNAKDTRLHRALGWAALVAALLQTIGLIRYLDRLPDDWVGIVLYVISIVAFVLVAVGIFVQARTAS